MRTGLLAVIFFLTGLSAAFGGEKPPAGMTELEKILSQPLPGQTSQEEAPIPSAPSIPSVRRNQPQPTRSAQENLYPEIRVKVTSPRHTVLSSQMAGKVAVLAIRDGECFEEGDPLLSLDATLENIQLAKAQANLRRRELLATMIERLYELGTKGEVELNIARADIAEAEAEVDFYRARLSRMRITAPFSGRAGEVFVRELQVVGEGQALFEIIDESVMELEFIVSSLWLPWFKPGLIFEVRIDELDTRYSAVLERIGGKVDPLSKSINAYARLLDADDRLMEGMSGEAFIANPAGEEK